jgi:hypothetical protein
MNVRTLFVKLEVDDEPIEQLARSVEADLLELGYNIIQVDVKDDLSGDTLFSTTTPDQPF